MRRQDAKNAKPEKTVLGPILAHLALWRQSKNA